MNNQEEGESLATRLLKKKNDKNQPIEKKSKAESAAVKELLVSDGDTDDENEKAAAPRKPNKASSKKNEKEKFYTYMSADNYEEFEEMFIYARKAISKKTGKKLKVTNMAELAIVLAKKQLFDKDKEGFLALIEEELELE